MKMPVKYVEHRLEDEDLVCHRCGDAIAEIGKEIFRTLEIISTQIVVREDFYCTYVCARCSKEAIETPIVTTPREKNIISGNFITLNTFSLIMTQKLAMGAPPYCL